jgi:hypothetical protein
VNVKAVEIRSVSYLKPHLGGYNFALSNPSKTRDKFDSRHQRLSAAWRQVLLLQGSHKPGSAAAAVRPQVATHKESIMTISRWLAANPFAPTLRALTATLLLVVVAQPGLAPALAAPAASAPSVPQGACTTVVTTTLDSGYGSLREAVGCALLGETVTFSPSLAGLAIVLTTTQIVLSQSITIDGSAAPGVKVDGNSATRIFNLPATGPVTITALTLQNGLADQGGAVLADLDSPLRLNDVNVLTSTATTNSGGGVYAGAALTLIGGRFQGNACLSTCYGGGLYANSALSISGTDFIDNEAVWGGGGAYAAAVAGVNGGRYQENECLESTCAGGALHAYAGLELIGSEFLTNTSQLRGGAVYAGPGVVVNARFEGNRCTADLCNGGAYFAAAASVFTGTHFITNTSVYHGGGLATAGYPLTITTSLFERNACTDINCYGGGLYSTGNLVLSDAQIFSNTSQYDGAGVKVDGLMLISNALFQGNRCANEFCSGGGAVAGSALTVTASSFISNSASIFGGGLFNFGQARIDDSVFIGNTCFNGSCEGGGWSSQGPGWVSNSSFSANHAAGNGGGLSGRSTLIVVNVTSSGNTADYYGGGLLAGPGSDVHLSNVTLADNTSPNAGGLYVFNDATASLTNTLFANNGPIACLGALAAGSNNLEWPGNACATEGPTAGFTTADALLLPLALNAPGPTLTHALLAGSPARDAGHAATCAGPLVNNRDQRGETRPLDSDLTPGALCDIGAFEAAAPEWLLYLPLVTK